MPGENAFKVEGVVTEVMANGTCWVKLANGHRLRGFATGRSKARVPTLKPGDCVTLQISPYDLSQGRLIFPLANDSK
jgi:translation initiation factor IF-1